MSPRRAVLLTLAAVSAVLVLSAIGAVSYYVWADRQDRIETLEADVDDLESQASELESQLAQAKRSASRQYNRGFDAGQKSERDLAKILGPLADFNPGWYIVLLKADGNHGIQVDESYDFLECELTYREEGAVFTRTSDNPC